MIASASLYLASKLKDDIVKIRDVINVTRNTLDRGNANTLQLIIIGDNFLHRFYFLYQGSQPLELNDEYWAIRDAITQAELLITRMLKFDLTIVHPHKYMLHYIKSLQEWFSTNAWNTLPLAKTAAACLQDFHHNPAILDYKPSHVAVCCLSIAFETYGVDGIQVPLADDFDDGTVWYKIFCNDLTSEKHWEIMSKIIDVYNMESELEESG